MNRIALGFASLFVAALPSVASAAASLRIEDRTGIAPGPYFIDLVFETTGPNQTVNEGLAFYDIGLKIPGPAAGVRFAAPYAQKLPAADGFVLSDAAEFLVAEATDFSLLLNVSANTAFNYDITTGKKAGRIYFTADRGFPIGARIPIYFDPNLTIFAAGIGDDPIIPVTVAPVIPEPTAAFLLAPAALLALRRRRVA